MFTRKRSGIPYSPSLPTYIKPPTPIPLLRESTRLPRLSVTKASKHWIFLDVVTGVIIEIILQHPLLANTILGCPFHQPSLLRCAQPVDPQGPNCFLEAPRAVYRKGVQTLKLRSSEETSPGSGYR